MFPVLQTGAHKGPVIAEPAAGKEPLGSRCRCQCCARCPSAAPARGSTLPPGCQVSRLILYLTFQIETESVAAEFPSFPIPYPPFDDTVASLGALKRNLASVIARCAPRCLRVPGVLSALQPFPLCSKVC